MSKFWDDFGDRGYMSDKLLNYNITYYRDLFEKFECDINKTVIEIGAGHGLSTEIFASIFKKYIAIEPNKVLFNKLSELKNNKYNDIVIKRAKFENIKIKDDIKVNIVIFTYSFQYIKYDVCIAKVNEILYKNGFLLILLPFKPFEFEDFNSIKNKKWRKQINTTITSIMSDENYELLYFTKNKNYVILLKKVSE